VPLGVRIPVTGSYHLKATELTVDGAVWLEDVRTGQFIDLDQTSEYQFHSTAGTFQERFRLHFSPVSPAYLIASVADGFNTDGHGVFAFGKDLHIQLGGITKASVTVLDMTGRIIVATDVRSSDAVIPLDVPTGIYVVRLERSEGVSVHRVGVR
jgi:hypothetical protein